METRIFLAVAASMVPLGQPVRADYAAEVLADSPLAYWRLGDAAGSLQAIDLSGGATHLDYTLFNDADFGQSGAVDDADTAVRFTPAEGDNTPLNGGPSTHPSLVAPDPGALGFASGESFSVEYWIQAAPGNTSTGNAGVVTKGYSSLQALPWYLSRYNAGRVDFFLRDINSTNASVAATAGVGDGRWHHVVCTYDAAFGEIAIYVDGALQSTTGGVAPDAYGTNLDPFTLANHFNRRLDVALDEVAVYAAALAPDRIAAHYAAAGIVAPEPGAEALLAVDFGSSAGSGGGLGGVQDGFAEFAANEGDGLDPVAMDYPSSAAAVGEAVTVTVAGYTHWRNYAAPGATYGLDDLVSDNVLRNADGTMTLTLDALRSGAYQFTTYHVSTQFGGGTFSLTVNDAAGERSIADAVPVARASELQAVTFEAISDGTPITLTMTGGANSTHLSLCGFTVAAPPGSGLRMTDFAFDPGTRVPTFTWDSVPGAHYLVEWTADGDSWIEIDDSYPSGGETTTYTGSPEPEDASIRLYRVQNN